MKLEHIALTISDPEEINNFYRNLLDLKLEKTFILSKNLAEKVFHFSKETSVFTLQNEKLCLEVFVASGQKQRSFNHLCLSVKNREELFLKTEKENYDCTRIERDVFDLMFIKDKYGNIFELKEKS